MAGSNRSNSSEFAVKTTVASACYVFFGMTIRAKVLFSPDRTTQRWSSCSPKAVLLSMQAERMSV